MSQFHISTCQTRYPGTSVWSESMTTCVLRSPGYWRKQRIDRAGEPLIEKKLLCGWLQPWKPSGQCVGISTKGGAGCNEHCLTARGFLLLSVQMHLNEPPFSLCFKTM